MADITVENNTPLAQFYHPFTKEPARSVYVEYACGDCIYSDCWLAPSVCADCGAPIIMFMVNEGDLK